jgi:ribosome biogenesis GTPase A
MGFWPVVLHALKNSDVVLLIVDARMSEMTTNSEIIRKVEMMKGKRLFLVFNKIDLIPKSEIEKLRNENPNAFFISGKTRVGAKELKASLDNMAENWVKPSLRVGLVGYPNVGKSSVLNLIAPGAKAKVKPVSGTTKTVQWIRVGKLRLQDSPGVIPIQDSASKAGFVSAKDPHKLRNPEKVAIRIVEFLRKKGPILERFYGVSGGSDYELFLAIGKKRGYLLKGGEIDEGRTAIRVIEDWQRGEISLR